MHAWPLLSHPAAEPLPDFNALPDLIGTHARTQPHAAALIDAGGQLDYAALDAAMDRVAATLAARRRCKPGDTIAICALACNAYVVLFMGALRAGLAVAPLAPSSTPAADRRDDGRLAARATCFSMRPTRTPCRPRSPATCSASASTTRRGETRLSDWLAPAGSKPEAVAHRPAWRLQHHLFVGHHRHAQGHRAAARDALGARSARAEAGGYGPEQR